MHLIKRCVLGLSISLATLLGAAVPALASDAYYYPDNSAYYHQDPQGVVNVYVQVNNQYGGYRSPSDFTIHVSGANASQQYFAGSQLGTTVRLNGQYSVSVYNQTGYNPSYSGECSGTVAAREVRTCYVTLTNSTYSYDYPYQDPSQYYPNQYVQPYAYQPVTYSATYVPSLPNTGFEPVSQLTTSLVLALVIVLGLSFLPYVRKTFIAVLR